MSALSDYLPIVEANDNAKAGFDISKEQMSLGHLLGDERNRDAARGSFFSGGTGLRADWLRQQSANNIGDINFGLQSTLQQLTINRLMAATGVTSIA